MLAPIALSADLPADLLTKYPPCGTARPFVLPRNQPVAVQWMEPARLEDGHIDKDKLQMNMERRLRRLLEQGDVLGAKRLLERFEQSDLELPNDRLESIQAEIKVLEAKGQFWLLQ